MKKAFTLFAIALCLIINLEAQLKVSNTGFIGLGSVTSPTSQLEFGNNQWLKLTATSGKSGILFYETGTNSATDVTYGARMYYDESNDRFLIVTKQEGVDRYGISIQRTYGRVGIGMVNPSYTLDVNGYVRATNITVSSDSRLKTNITNFERKDANKLFTLQAKKYKPLLREPLSFASSESDSKEDTLSTVLRVDDPSRKTFFGYLAQDVQKVFPELVSEDEEGYLSIDYLGLIPVLVEAMKAQQAEITALKKQIAALVKNEETKPQ